MSAISCLLFYLIFYISAHLSFTEAAEDECVTKNPCRCEFSNGTGIDLTESAKSTFYSAQKMEQSVAAAGQLSYALTTYYFHPCFDAKSVDFKSNCAKELAICRQTSFNITVINGTATLNDTGLYEDFGTSNTAVFMYGGKMIKYPNEPSHNYVGLVCADSEDKLQVNSTENRNEVYLTFYSRNACLKQLEVVGRSTGSTLLIIFFSCVIFYLVLGVCTKKFLMGATGIEVVPNLAFWSELPNLVKDGWAFAVNGFRLPARGPGPVSSPDPNSYDSI